MRNNTGRKGRGIFSLILVVMIMCGVAAYPCVSDAAGSGLSELFSKGGGSSGSSLSSLFSGMAGGSGSGLSSLLGGSSSSGGDKSQSFLYWKAETCPFRQMYISGTAKEGSMTYEIGKSVDELYKSLGGTSTEITESDCEICNALAGALGGESYQEYQKQLAEGKTTSTASASGVTVYTAPGCGYCDQVKQLLKEKGVSYKEIDVTKDKAAAGEMVAKTGQTGVPVTVINGKYVVGYKPEEIEKLLGTSTTQTRTQKTTTTAQKSAQKTNTGGSSGSSSLSSMLGGDSSGSSLSGLLGGGGSGGGALSGLLGGNSGSAGMLSGLLGGNSSGGGIFSGLLGGRNSGNNFSSNLNGKVKHVTFQAQCVLANGDEKTLNMHMWYPAEKQGPYPLLVFAHGNLMGAPTQCPYLTEDLAENGYVVCATTHSDSSNTANKPKGQDTSPGRLGLPLEVKAEIDEMLRLNADPSSEIYGLIDEGSIGVSGHSHGGWSTEVVCGAAPDELYADNRVKAGFFLEPANSYSLPMAQDASANMHTASMWWFGTMDELVRPAKNKFPYDAAPAPKYCAVVSGLDHFMAAMGSSGRNAITGEYALAFFNRYLKNDTSADEILQTEHPSFASYEYDLGTYQLLPEEGESGGQEGVGEWKEDPAYGPKPEETGEWKETPGYSIQPEDDLGKEEESELEILREWQGETTSAGAHWGKNLVIKTEEEWKPLWARGVNGKGEKIYNGPPAVDFATEMAIFVSAIAPYPGARDIEISGITQEETEIIVSVDVTEQSSSGNHLTVLSYPFHAVVIAKSALPVRFVMTGEQVIASRSRTGFEGTREKTPVYTIQPEETGDNSESGGSIYCKDGVCYILPK